MRGFSHKNCRQIVLGFVFFALVAAGITFFWMYIEGTKLKGLLIDLELEGPDPSRYRDLRYTVLNKLPSEIPALNDFQVKLDYVHFSDVTKELLNSGSIDFVLLSPQGTPWHMYRNGAAEKLGRAKTILKEMISNHRTPVLGICGGHQFLALAFGGSLGFIDPTLECSTVGSYPKEAVAERGIVELETLMSDPIFEGVVNHPGKFWVTHNHYEEVKLVPEPFINLARSSMSEIQLIRIPGRPVYGVAFHPERGLNPHHEANSPANGGKQILANFMTMVIAEKNLKGFSKDTMKKYF
ncbi:MAG: gamma-glutamyl-gamma-aminobutyrate hydrolase family protein [Deltaproteobacteria bacterium]|nr:gamma-glutamyl-gamma-aminobutyrate hydrolase family protein [Deltaproteobacteria bacterium]